MWTPEPHRRYVEIVLSVSTGQGRGCRGAAAREQVRAVELGPSLGDARGRLTPLRAAGAPRINTKQREFAAIHLGVCCCAQVRRLLNSRTTTETASTLTYTDRGRMTTEALGITLVIRLLTVQRQPQQRLLSLTALIENAAAALGE